jgi:hypothetical protein
MLNRHHGLLQACKPNPVKTPDYSCSGALQV